MVLLPVDRGHLKSPGSRRLESSMAVKSLLRAAAFYISALSAQQQLESIFQEINKADQGVFIF